jgi:8-amino-7-oxononanoate synthase
LSSRHQIVPILVGDEERAAVLQRQLQQRGYHVSNFHYPATPWGNALLRMSVCDDMTFEELKGFVAALKSEWPATRA